MATTLIFVTDEEIGWLIEQTKHLTCTLPEIKIDVDPEEAIITASIKLVGKVLSKSVEKKNEIY